MNEKIDINEKDGEEKIDEMKISETAEKVTVTEETPVDTEKQTESAIEAESEPSEETYASNSRIKNYIEKPLTKKEKKKRISIEKHYEKQYDKKLFHAKEKKTFRFKVMLGLLITLGIILVFRYILKIDMTVFFETLLIPSIIFSGLLVVLAFYFIFSDSSEGNEKPDAITDFFIINKGKISSRTKKNLENRINTRFIMITFLKLFQKEQIAIVNERIIYGTMDTEISKDEVAILDFLLDNEIKTLDDFLEVLDAENPVKHLGVLGKADNFYEKYKDAIIEMAHDKQYVNQSINKSKFVLRLGGIIFSLTVIALLAKGQGTLMSLGLYSLQAVVLLVISNFIHARSKGAHKRIAEIRKQKKVLQSPKENVYTALIYNYLFGKEDRILKRINKYHKDGTMPTSEYKKFSETYNGFNYLLNSLKDDYDK